MNTQLLNAMSASDQAARTQAYGKLRQAFLNAFAALALAGCVSTGPDDGIADVDIVTPEPSEPVAVEETREAIAKAPPEDLWERIRPQLRYHTMHNARIGSARDQYLGQPRYIELITPRAQRYLHYIVSQVEQRDMPIEIALLPLVESAMNPFAISPQRAAGLWQFMPATADYLGMRRDWWFDARLDIRASTDTALDYLESLNQEFDGDWLLALAAYNAGKGRVRRELRRRQNAGLEVDYWSLNLPRETRHYVPRLIALSTLIAFDEALGLELPPIANKPGFVAVETDGQIEMLRAAQLAGISLEELRRYNPGNLRWATLPDINQEILVPPAAETALRIGLASLAPDDRVTWEHYRIRRGDSLIRIAKRFDTQVELLREVNNLNGSFIRAGDTLMIPDSSEWRDSMALAKQGRTAIKRSYKVRSGDSLYVISERFDVTIDDLITWNQLDPARYLQPGQSLTLYIEGG